VPRLLEGAASALIVIDVQEAYRDKTVGHRDMVDRICRLVRAARIFDVPILVTEQYPKGIGHTQSEVVELLDEDQTVIEKMTMSCCGRDAFVEELKAVGRRQLVVCGIEAHACVNQTVHDLLERGFEVHLPRDAISSRFPLDGEVAWQKMTGSGAVPSSTEMICLEWVRTAEAAEFRDIHRLIK